MTFTEAAVQVLRLVGKPLHYKEITDVAIEKDLLSHVGKSPEVTMGARLAAIVKKDPKETALVRIKPGVFALAEWDTETVEKGLADRTPALRRIEQRQKEGLLPVEAAVSVCESEEGSGPSATEDAAPAGEEMDDDEIARAELSAAATELFEVEDDDDEPILGRPEDEDEDDEVIDEEDDDDGDRRGRRRRRRGRGRTVERSGDDDLPGYTVSDASDATLAEVSSDEPSGAGERQESRGKDRDRGDRADRERGDRGDRERDRGERDRSERDRDRGDRERDRGDRGERDRTKRTEGAVVGRDLADEVVGWLGAFRRQGGAPAQKLAEQRRGGNAGELLAAQVTACCYADNARLTAEGKRARFRFVSGNRIALTEWALDKDLLRLETEMFAAVDKYRELLRSRLARKIAELPHKSFGEFAYLLLERAGYQRLSVVKRPGAHSSELHLAGVLVAAGGETPVAIVIRKDGRDVGRERVTELRGSLHHYGSCSLGLLVTAGQVLSGARDEAAVTGATPVTFLDGAALAGLCELYGIATVPQQLTLSVPDQDLFDTLRQG